MKKGLTRLNKEMQRSAGTNLIRPLKNVDTRLLNGEHESSVLDGIQ
jgi:hypothetical protein